ncbi:MAG: ABC transporter ATP-binding protein [Thermoanaerobaculia bacterium]|nr:ABC transporter ATP-binding protein [Thermoanaerobaculia bacterium]
MTSRSQSASANPVLAAKNVTVRYGRTTVLQDLHLHVDPGEVVALVGRNGAGKSSLVRCLLGQQKATSGRCSLFGEDVWRHRARLMARVGVVPEEPDAPPTMNARALGKFCSRLYPSWDAESFSVRLARYGVPDKVAFRSLSKGQKAQVMLALALAPAPDLLILDDPTLGLDAVARRGVFEEVIGELADRGISVLLTSHDLAGVESIAQRVALLRDGGLRIDEELEELKQRFRRLILTPKEESDRELLDELVREAVPAERKKQGRRVSILASRWDEELEASFRDVFGERLEVEPAALEEIIIALGSSATDPSPDGSGKET